MQDYKSLCAAATISDILINIQTHTNAQTESMSTSLYEKLSQLS